MTTTRERLIEEAEAYARDGLSLPADLITALMSEGIDHTQFTKDHAETGEDIHNVD